MCWFTSGIVIFLISVIVFRLYTNYLGSSSEEFSLNSTHVMITGGSSGIGLAVARNFAERKLNYPSTITLVARKQEGLDSAASLLRAINPTITIQTAKCDVSNYDSCREIFDNQIANCSPVDVLINSAGTCLPGTLDSLSIQDIDTTISVNLTGSIYLTKILLPIMKSRRKGKIVFISSQAGQIGLYGYTAYSASKFALKGLAEALQMECDPFGVKVTVAYPSDTDTPCLAMENARKPEATKLISSSSSTMKPEAVARRIVQGIIKEKFDVWVNLDGWMLSILSTGMSLPDSLLDSLIQVLMLPVLRIISFLYSMHFRTLVRKCERSICEIKKVE